MFKEIMEFPFVYREGNKMLEENIKGFVLDALILRCSLDIQVSILNMQVNIDIQFRGEVHRWSISVI